MVKSITKVFLLAFISLSVSAETKLSHSDYSSADQSQLNIDHSKVWNIRSEDWSRYEHIMATEGQYFWQHLDPITILGLNEK